MPSCKQTFVSKINDQGARFKLLKKHSILGNFQIFKLEYKLDLMNFILLIGVKFKEDNIMTNIQFTRNELQIAKIYWKIIFCDLFIK